MESPLRPESREEPSKADVDRATDNVIGQLAERGIDVPEGESPERLVTLLEAVERFEAVVAARGGDSFTNSLQSSEPDQSDYVLPRRLADESLDAYTERIQQRASTLERDEG